MILNQTYGSQYEAPCTHLQTEDNGPVTIMFALSYIFMSSNHQRLIPSWKVHVSPVLSKNMSPVW